MTIYAWIGEDEVVMLSEEYDKNEVEVEVEDEDEDEDEINASSQDQQQYEACIRFIDSPQFLTASDDVIDGIHAFIISYFPNNPQVRAEFNDDEPRDDKGEWTKGGGGDGNSTTEKPNAPLAQTNVRGRLQAIAVLGRLDSNLPKNAYAEVAIMKTQVYSPTPPWTSHTAIGDETPVKMQDLPTAASNTDLQAAGAVVHMYVYTKDANGNNVVAGTYVGWIGTKDQPPILLNVNGTDLYDSKGVPIPGLVIPQKPESSPKQGDETKKPSGGTTKKQKDVSEFSGNNYATPTYDLHTARINASEFGTNLEKVQLAVAPNDNGKFVDNGALKAYVCKNIAERMGNTYDAQLFPIVRVVSIPDGAPWADRQIKEVSAADLLTKDDVWQQSGSPGGTIKYSYVGKLGGVTYDYVPYWDKTVYNTPSGMKETPITLGHQSTSSGMKINMTGDTPKIATALREEGVSNLVHQWAMTSNDQHNTSLALQEAAVKEFGLTNTKAWGKGGAALKTQVQQVLDVKEPMLRAFLRAQYELTQESFKALGVTKVQLFRGFSASVKSLHAAPKGAQVEVTMRPLSSFSYSRQTAGNFGGHSNNAVVIAGEVPVENILSTPLTGNGCQNESELVVLGGTNVFNLDKGKSAW